MRRLRSILGILFILISIAGLFFWEWKGREVIMTEKVLVAKGEIQKGVTVNSSMFTVKGVSKEDLLEEALTPDELSLLQGKVTSQLVAKNGQVIMEYFRDNEFYLDKDESVFVINPEWIAMRSSALRRGDLINIYGSNDLGLLGTFRIAYVKDASDREVRNVNGESGGIADRTETIAAKAGGDANGILNRPDSSSVIDHIEIISTYADYENLVNITYGADGTTPAALIIVQRGGSD